MRRWRAGSASSQARKRCVHSFASARRTSSTFSPSPDRGLKDHVIVVDPAEKQERLVRQGREALVVVLVGYVGEADETFVTYELDTFAVVHGREPGGEQFGRDEAILGGDFDLVEGRRLDDLEQARRLRRRLRIAERRARPRAVEPGQQLAEEILVGGQKLARAPRAARSRLARASPRTSRRRREGLDPCPEAPLSRASCARDRGTRPTARDRSRCR